MSEYFVTIWHADDGVPTSYTQAEQIRSKLRNQPATKKHLKGNTLKDYLAFTKEMADFAGQAMHIYREEALHNISLLHEEANDYIKHNHPILCVRDITLPNSGFSETFSILARTLQKHNFIMLDDENGAMLNDGTVFDYNNNEIEWELDRPYQQWLNALKDFDKPINELPNNSGKLHNYVQKRKLELMADAGLADCYTNSGNIVIDMGRYQLSVGGGAGYDELSEKTSFFSGIDIYVNDITELRGLIRSKGKSAIMSDSFSYTWSFFYKFPNDPRPVFKYFIKDLAMLDAEIKRSVDMFLYLYPHVTKGLDHLYEFLHTSYDDPHLGVHTFRAETKVFADPKTMIALARLLKKPNLDELIEYYRQKIIELFAPAINVCREQVNEDRLYRKNNDSYLNDHEVDENGELILMPQLVGDEVHQFDDHLTKEYDEFTLHLKQITDEEIDEILAKKPRKPTEFG